MGQVRGPDRVQDAVAGFALTVRCGPAPIPQTTKSDRRKIQTMNDQYPANSQPVIVVGAGPAGVPRPSCSPTSAFLSPSWNAAAVRSDRISEFMGSTATPRLKAGALQHTPHHLLPAGIPAALRPGGLIPNPLVSAGDGPPVRLDTILAGRPAVLTARRPDAGLTDFCRRHALVLARISSTPGTGTPPEPGAGEDAGWIDAHLAGDAPPAAMRALVADPALTVIVRPDRVIAAAETRSRQPHLPWYVPASAGRGSRPRRAVRHPARLHQPVQPDRQAVQLEVHCQRPHRPAPPHQRT